MIRIIVFTVFLISGYGLVPNVETVNDQQPHQIKVMSYNIHHANPPSKPKEVIDIDAIIRVIEENDPDLVALQEVDVKVPRSGWIDESQIIASRLEMSLYFAKAIDYHGGEYGIAILSKFPIAEEQTYNLPSREGTEPRVLATVKIELPEGITFRFGCTHLGIGRDPVNQVSQIKKILEIAKTEPLPFIIAGDFNAQSGSEVINLLDSHFRRTCDDCPPTIPSSNPKSAIDFIAFKPNEKFSIKDHQVIDEQYASDHLPIISTINFK